jgi:ParB family transcriptional regulator, chromosome partitioning protein
MSSPDPKRRALGRGLDALLPAPPTAGYGDKSVFVCALERIVPQTGQPRQHFDVQRLEELAQSIREHGLVEPLVVRRVAGPGEKFELVAGERRWRALQRAGVREALVVVKDVSGKEAFELALIENVQREELNPIELAEAFDRLVREHGYSQEALAERVGKDRTTIANALRLLKLPPAVRTRVIEGELTEGHARALLGAGSAAAIEALADRVRTGRLSVRATEALVRQHAAKAERDRPALAEGKGPAVRDLETRLTRTLGAKVEVRDRGNKGEIAIPYSSLDALDRILEKLMPG